MSSTRQGRFTAPEALPLNGEDLLDGVMPEPVRLQVFQRSFSTKDGRGRGLGTYSVKLLTERYLGGSVSFESMEGQGTTFTVELPAEG